MLNQDDDHKFMKWHCTCISFQVW